MTAQPSLPHNLADLSQTLPHDDAIFRPENLKVINNILISL